ncbi:MAG TPA: hypothetical protein PLI09_21190 [Candidatus Hydrogenedentes bacterium]|nr:hypothetical protein [Candidatus Hydrogenedentota bacterium]
MKKRTLEQESKTLDLAGARARKQELEARRAEINQRLASLTQQREAEIAERVLSGSDPCEETDFAQEQTIAARQVTSIEMALKALENHIQKMELAEKTEHCLSECRKAQETAAAAFEEFLQVLPRCVELHNALLKAQSSHGAYKMRAAELGAPGGNPAFKFHWRLPASLCQFNDHGIRLFLRKNAGRDK